MAELDEFLDGESRPPAKGTLGTESRWLHFCDLDLRSGRLLVIDPSFAPYEQDGLLVDLPVTRYTVSAKVLDYGTEKRVSRLQVVTRLAEATLGPEIGKTWSDTARTGVCDYQLYKEAWGDDERGWQIVGPTLEELSSGVAVLDEAAGAILPFLESGFGDGEFPVFELLDGHSNSRVGIEVQFIAQGEPYPF